MNTSREVIQTIRRLREAKGMSVSELARRVGISKAAQSRYENGQREFPINDIGIYADVLNASIEDLLGLEQKKVEYHLTPLIGTICAGDGMLAEQNIEEYIHYPFPGRAQPDYALRVKGDSMLGAGIEDGDIVYMRHSLWADYNGQIVAALINAREDGTLKRIRWSAESPLIRLEPANEDYDTIEIAPNHVTICGLYMGHFKPEKEV